MKRVMENFDNVRPNNVMNVGHNAPTPSAATSSDVHLTHIEGPYWQINVVTHVFINDVEIAQGVVSHVFDSRLKSEHPIVPR